MHRNRHVLVLLAAAILVAYTTDSDDSTSSTPSFRPTASVQDLMLSVIDPAADRLFDEGGPLDVTCERCHQRYWYPRNPNSLSTTKHSRRLQ